MDYNAINTIINNFVAQFDLTAKIDTDFSYYWRDDTIGYTLAITERFDRLWNEYLNKNYPEVTAPIFIWSILHEIGHAETDDYITPYMHTRLDLLKKKLDPNSDKDTMFYYSLADEVLATDWAYKYIMKHPDEIKALWNRLQPEIMAFYEREGITN